MVRAGSLDGRQPAWQRSASKPNVAGGRIADCFDSPGWNGAVEERRWTRQGWLLAGADGAATGGEAEKGEAESEVVDHRQRYRRMTRRFSVPYRYALFVYDIAVDVTLKRVLATCRRLRPSSSYNVR